MFCFFSKRKENICFGSFLKEQIKKRKKNIFEQKSCFCTEFYWIKNEKISKPRVTIGKMKKNYKKLFLHWFNWGNNWIHLQKAKTRKKSKNSQCSIKLSVFGLGPKG